MTNSSRRRSTMGLRQAASVVFGLAAVLPILLFVSLLARADLIRRTDVQVGLVLAVAASVLGFVLFRRLVGRITHLAGELRASGPGGATTLPIGDRAASVPGLGQVTEVGQLTGSFYQMLGDLRGATQRLEDLVFKLGTLNETVELAARIPRIQDLLGLVLHTTMRVVRAPLGAIMLYDPERQTLRTAASRGTPDDLVSDAETKIDDSLAGGVVRTGEPLLVEDMGADPRLHGSDMSRHGAGPFLCMPIRAGDRVIGVVNLARRREESGAQPQPFSPIDLQFLNAVMTSVGYAVDNARLLEEAQESARRLQNVIDDLKAAQEELVRGETVRAIGQLAGGMAHHLNNLFAVILGRTELLMGATTSAPGRRSLDIIRRAAEDGADVARRVQRFSRLHPLSEPVSVDVNQLVVAVVEQMRQPRQDQTPAGHGIDIEVQTSSIPPAVGEAAPIREALTNLLVNALEAMPDGGRVTVKTWIDGQRVRCSVTDTGTGMPDDVRRRALQPFFTTKGPKSTGLGLSVAYGAVQRYGGGLEIDSVPGRGTTVIISLPVAPPRPADSAASLPAAPVVERP